jgi:enoyl-CoA hydratase/carnithine racemase
VADFTQIRVERDGPVAVVTLDRPEQMNAWTWTMSAELGRAFAQLDADDSCRAIVVTGAGRAFCAGAHLGDGEKTFSGGSTAIGTREDAGRGLVNRSVPNEEVLPTTMALAHDIATNTAPVSAALTKRVLWELLTEPARGPAAKRQGAMFAWTGRQADAKEGVMAFLERREPQWKLSKTGDYPEDL